MRRLMEPNARLNRAELGGESKRDFSFGRHSLVVFDSPRYARLALRNQPVEKRAHWEAFHEGRTIPVMKSRNGLGLVQILRDPAHKGNLLAVRKESVLLPYGKITVSTVSKAGEEERVGEVTLGLKPDVGKPLFGKAPENPRFLPFLSTLRVAPYRLSKPNLRSTELRKMEGRIKRAAADAKEDDSELRALHLQRAEFARALQEDTKSARRPEGYRAYGYRGRGIGGLLIDLSAELAETTGAPRIEAYFDRMTLGDAPIRHGWRRTGTTQWIGHYRKSLGPKKPSLIERLLGK